MNDGFNDLSFDSDIGTNEPVFPENAEPSPDMDSSFDTSDVSASLGSDSVSVPDSPISEADSSDNEISDTEADLPSTETSEESSSSVSFVDYSQTLEHIDTLLYEQLDLMNTTKSVSGNSITVSFDSSSMEAITELQTGQKQFLEEQQALTYTLSLVLFAIVCNFLFASARRVVKHMFNRKDD